MDGPADGKGLNICWMSKRLEKWKVIVEVSKHIQEEREQNKNLNCVQSPLKSKSSSARVIDFML